MKFLKYLAISLPIIALLGYLLYQKFPINPPMQLSSNPYNGELPLDKLTLPEGFKIDVYAEGVENARSMCLSPNGTLFVGTRGKGNVYALVDTDKDGRSDKQHDFAACGGMQSRSGRILRR